MIKKPFVNKQIRARKVRLIQKDGTQVGIIGLEEALKKAEEQGLDLIQITKNVDPPICKILDYGKYLYKLKKKDKDKKNQRTGEIKGIRLSFNISPHDLETRAKQAEKFLRKGYKIRTEIRLRGRQKYLTGFAKEKIKQFFEQLKKRLPVKVETELKREARGLTMTISPAPEKGTISPKKEQ